MQPAASLTIQHKRWSRLPFVRPEEELQLFRGLMRRMLESGIPAHELPERMLRAPTRRERWQATLFCAGLQGLDADHEIAFCMHEESDHDCVVRIRGGDGMRFLPVQLKEVVSKRLNPDAGLQQVLDGLTQYADLSRTAVVVYLHHDGMARSSVRLPALEISALWFCGLGRVQPLEFVLRRGLGGGPAHRFGVSA